MKLKGTYVDALPQLVNPATGRVHTSLQPGRRGDRTAEQQRSEPAEHSDPHASSAARSARAFVAEPGHVLISADYSQIELRVLAHLSGDDGARSRRSAAATTFTIGPPSGVRRRSSGLDTHELRRRAKIINYALLYGKTAFTLAKDIGVRSRPRRSSSTPTSPASRACARFIDRTLAEARVTGVVKTMYGRRRLVPELTSKNGQIRMAAEREAVNMPIQGTAADILKSAMIDVHAALAPRRPTRG